MSVNPGFGGQSFIPYSLNKIRRLKELRQELGLSYRIEVDGGVAHDTIAPGRRSWSGTLGGGKCRFRGWPAPSRMPAELLQAAQLARRME